MPPTPVQAINDGDILRVVNKGGSQFRLMYDSRTYTLKPNEDNFLPFAAVALWFGDPRSAGLIGSIADDRGLRAWVPDRETEVRRLRAKYDNQMGDETMIVNHPVVEVYTLDGERIYTVLDDPAGEMVIAASPTVADERDLRELVARQQQQIATLMSVVMKDQDEQGSGQGESPPIPQPPPIPAPGPVPEPGGISSAPGQGGPTEGLQTGETVTMPPSTSVPPAPTMPPNLPQPESPDAQAQATSTTVPEPTGDFHGTPLFPTTPQADDALPPADQG